MEAKTVTLTEADCAAAFTEWERRYRLEPERFMSEGEKLMKGTPRTYGDGAAPYFLQIVDELRSSKLI